MLHTKLKNIPTGKYEFKFTNFDEVLVGEFFRYNKKWNKKIGWLNYLDEDLLLVKTKNNIHVAVTKKEIVN